MELIEYISGTQSIAEIGKAKNAEQIVNVRNAEVGEAVAIGQSLCSAAFWLAVDAEAGQALATHITKLGGLAECLPEMNSPFANFKFSSRQAQFRLIALLGKLVSGEGLSLVCSPELLFFPLPSLESFIQHTMRFAVGSSTRQDDLIVDLVENGFVRTDRVDSMGEFAIHGDIVDIFCVGKDEILRINFFGDEIESMYYIDALTLAKTDSIPAIEILPAKLTYVDKDSAIKNIAKALADLSKLDYTNASELLLTLTNGLEQDSAYIDAFLLSLFTEDLQFSILDYIPNGTVICVYRHFQCAQAIRAFGVALENKLNNMFGKLEQFGNLLVGLKKHISRTLEKFAGLNLHQLLFENIELSNDGNVLNVNLDSTHLPNYLTKFERLMIEMRIFLSEGKTVVLALKDEDTLNSIDKILTENNLSHVIGIDIVKAKINLTLWDYDSNISFNKDKFVLIGSQNFAHKKTIKKTSKTALSYTPAAGDFVVHNVHGIGRCVGTENIESMGANRDYFKIMYANNAILYVPCENTDSLSLYMTDSNSAVRLSKIGGKEFAMKTAKAMSSIKDMAKELLVLYSERESITREPYAMDDYIYSQFESTFPFVETIDQTQAIEDVAKDMHSSKIMDRLICGDVGFGKTEVAYRAAFRAILDGKQVALLAPTTVLALQHYMNAIKRFADFGIEIEMLNRFRTKAEVTQILAKLSSGKIQLVCGTHRLLSKDVVFSNLGLLILDEEQRFGVDAKEKIKKIRSNIDVLTLTATPIPRTLNMALMHIRDISILNTPPVNRKAIKTYVLKYDISTIVDAIQKETARDGQVLIVCNHIDKLYTLAAELRKYLGDEISIDVAHGQMPERMLEDAAEKLYERKTDVFISTTIIENGIDLPFANTLVVLDSQLLGLSQMYQLRGRVGRSQAQAYAYFTYPNEKALTTDASERLECIAENTELGSGIRLAMRDLQLRGAGEILGAQQHGHIVNIGYDMYIKLLEQATRELKGEKVAIEREVKLDIAISANLPQDYIADEIERLRVYNKIFMIKTITDRKDTLLSLQEMYGSTPASVIQLANLALIKSFAVAQNIEHIIINKNQCNIIYYKDTFDSQVVAEKLTKSSLFSIKIGRQATITMDADRVSVSEMQSEVIRYLTLGAK